MTEHILFRVYLRASTRNERHHADDERMMTDISSVTVSLVTAATLAWDGASKNRGRTLEECQSSSTFSLRPTPTQGCGKYLRCLLLVLTMPRCSTKMRYPPAVRSERVL